MDPLTRVTAATADVLDVLLQAEDPVWGLHVVGLTGRPAGSVYPILERLERLGWITSEWEEPSERRGARRRLYVLSGEARTAAGAAIARARRGAALPARPRGVIA
ncbi:PadR family transcriptional regulator [Microbacterium sp.]|uniref:PadR family transcriptional regulator n=1 Tax=Microbacterium sp. TaxID=51671 RepID=UPI0039E5C550